MKRIPLKLLIVSLLPIFCACQKGNNDNKTEESTESEESTIYEKDEEGFYILEDDYFSYSENPNDKLLKNEVYIPNSISDVPHYNQLRMYIGDKLVPIYTVKTNMSQVWTPDASNRMSNSYATFGLKGKVTVKLQANFNYLNIFSIHPLSRGVNYIVDANRRVAIFEISDIGQYTIEMRSGRTLHLFVEDIDVMTNNDSNVMYFEPGVHNSQNDSRISNNRINLTSGNKVFIAPGAFIYAKFIANNASNISITGPGYIDGSIFERNADNGTVLVPIEFNYCSNIKLKDFACVDPAGWTFNMYFCNGVTIDNVKVISSRSNGDGISLQSCQNVDVSNSFIRTWDDSLVVKNYPKWSNRNEEGTTKNIHFNDCILWTDLAQSMEIGYETVGQVMEDITFDNITVLHNYHKAVISIHNGNNANIKNVKFQNITIEDASIGKGDGSKHLIDLRNLYSTTWSSQHKVTSLGSIDGVDINNVKVLSGIENPEVLIEGCIDSRSEYSKDPHYVDNVTITDFELYGSVLDNTYPKLTTNSYVRNLNFVSSGNPVNGASYLKPDTSGYGNNITFIN